MEPQRQYWSDTLCIRWEFGVRIGNLAIGGGARVKTWVESRDGVDYLVRSGTGRVSAVEPVGLQDPDGGHALYRVEIECVSPPGWARSIRFSARAQVPSESTVHRDAVSALQDGALMQWEIQWHRHSWIPGNLSMNDLNVDSDTTAQLMDLERVAALRPEAANTSKGHIP